MGISSGRFADAKRLWACPRGFCLSRLSTLKQKQRSGLRFPTRTKQFVRFWLKSKNHLTVDF